MDIEKAIRDYLPQTVHLSLATCSADQPWVCEVHFVFDSDLNLYFRSKATRRHSQEISLNSNVAGNIVTQHDLSEKVRGVYFEGSAEMLKGVTVNDNVYKLFCEQQGKDETIIHDADSSDGHKFYKITVREFSLFDGRESNPGQKHILSWNT